MARRVRGILPNRVYHVCNRATERIRLFASESDYELWMSTFAEALEKYPMKIYAYCVMPNHYHLLVSGHERGHFVRFFQWLNATHAKRTRIRAESIGKGAVYQSRYRAHAVKLNQVFLVVARYIERNPVRSGACTQPKEWRWSSAGQTNDRIPLTQWPIAKPPDWQEFLCARSSVIEEALIRKALLTGRPFGSITKI